MQNIYTLVVVKLSQLCNTFQVLEDEVIFNYE